MKLPSLSIQNLQEGLLRHAEKIVVAILGVLALTIAWGGVHALLRKSVQPNQTPEALTTLTSETVRHIDAPKEVPPDTVRPAGQLAKALEPWRPQSLQDPGPPPAAIFSRPFAQDIVKRPKPEVFPIEDLRAIAGVAMLPDAAATPAFQDPVAGAGGGRSRRGRPREGESPREGVPPGLDGLAGLPDGQQAVPEVPGKVMPYVIVTGLVPVAKQRSEFARCFVGKGMSDPQRDLPRWGQYAVERGVITGGTVAKWERLKVATVQAFSLDGGAPLQPGGQPEPLQEDRLPPAFLLSPSDSEISYAAGLPQLLYDSWGAKAVHPWFLPELRKLMDQQVATAVEPKSVAAKDLAAKPADFLDDLVKVAGVKFVGETVPQEAAAVFAQTVTALDDSVSSSVADVGTSPNLVFVRSPQLERELAPFGGVATDTRCDLVVRVEKLGITPVARVLAITYIDATGAADGEPIVDPNPFPLSPVAMGNEFAPGGGAGGLADGGSEFRLFRFLDRTVKPGTSYRYRVRFALLNPNYGMDPRYLESAASTKDEFLVSAMSNDSPAVTVPDPAFVVIRTLGKDDAKALKLRKDTVELLVLGPKEGTGNYRFSRVITEPGGGVTADPSLNSKAETRVRGDNLAETGRTLVDIRGRLQDDDPAKSGPREMVEALLLRRDGTLEVVSYADSEPMFDRYRHTLPPVAPPGDDRRPPRQGPGGGAGQ